MRHMRLSLIFGVFSSFAKGNEQELALESTPTKLFNIIPKAINANLKILPGLSKGIFPNLNADDDSGCDSNSQATPSPTTDDLPGPSLGPSLGPSSPITSAPTKPSLTSTSPSNAPSLLNRISIPCPNPGESVEVPHNSLLLVRAASSNTLCSLNYVSTSSGEEIVTPAGRSYDGNSWESVKGLFHMIFECNEIECTTEVPDKLTDDKDSFFQLTTLNRGNVTSKDLTSRFLEQVTFGITKTDLEGWADVDLDSFSDLDDSFADWVDDQINAKEATSHRKLFRERMSTRALGAKLQGIPNHPCDANTRWRGYAISMTDWNSFRYRNRDIFEIEETNDGSAYLVLFDGKPLTEIDNLGMKNYMWDNEPSFDLSVPAMYRLCPFDWSHQERAGGRLCLLLGGHQRFLDMGNPEIRFYSVGGKRPENVIQLDASIFDDFVHLPGNEISGDEFLLPTGISHSMCDSLGLTDNQVFIEFSDGRWLLFDRRMQFMENLPESPAPNGGYDVYVKGSLCPNAYRTFMNAETCVLSDEAVCTNEGENTDFEIPLDPDDVIGLQTLSGRYVYAVEGIRPDYSGSPCLPNQRSRWLRIGDDESCVPTTFPDQTGLTLSELIEDSMEDGDGLTSDTVDTLYYNTNDDCSIPLTQNFTANPVFVVSEGSCYKLVHPDLHSVFDFTGWVYNHPGGADKITAFAGGTFLFYPGHHEMWRWDQGENYRDYVGRLGHTASFRDLPSSLQLDSILEEHGYSSFDTSSRTLICGSVNEVANDPTLGETGFVTHIGDDLEENYHHQKLEQKYNLWTEIALFSEDQLRQRVSWALAQIFAISQEAVNGDEQTEDFVYYYDIFVRNAFGNYFDILKEVSYSPMMADMLTYMRSQSTAYTLERFGVISFADENYAREIMQLFTIGTIMLNMDGTPILDDGGNPILSYTNDHIMSYARAWTGFYRWDQRGNIETSFWRPNNIDPMLINQEWRDVFPKINLIKGYVGDGYPLCADLPQHHFLRKGATYRLLGSKTRLELQENPIWGAIDLTHKSMTLDENESELFAKLCNDPSNTGDCTFLSQVTLDENLLCHDSECNVDTLGIVEVTDGIWFEYVRQPCVELAYFNDAKVVNIADRNWRREMCANPKLEAAGEACCESELDTQARGVNCEYTFEKMTFDTSADRCQEIQQNTCSWRHVYYWEGNPAYNPNPECFYYWHFPKWVDTECLLKVKVDGVSGKAAIVHDSQNPYWDQDNDLIMEENVRQSTPNFFPVHWTGEHPNFDNDCGGETCVSVFDGCLCDTTVVEEAVFTDSPPASVQDVMESLFIGSVSPDTFDESIYDDPVTQGDVVTFFRAGTEQSYDMDTIFMVEYLSKIYYFKNMRSTVVILDQSGSETQFTFRNPPHFLDLDHGDQRDAHHETHAVLESYFYHPNTPPFLAIHFINHFGISNPSPRYVEAVATAFKTGTYEYVKNSDSSTMSFGSNKYGDLEATIAAVILDREARSIVLDSDPSYGGMKEPFLKVISLMRSMEYAPDETRDSHRSDMVLRDLTRLIGQMTHDYQSIFSFFRREYSPTGLIQEGNLVAPEGQRYNSPTVIALMNGMYSLIKYGLTPCYGGFGHQRAYTWCEEGNSWASHGHLSFSPEQSDMESVVDELALLLTANRLDPESRSIISNIASQAEDQAASLRIAQQLVISTPEFHTTSLMENSGVPRVIPEPPGPSDRPYKAVVVMLLSGGMDSFNLFVPHSGCDTDMYSHYVDSRGNVHIPYSQLQNTIFSPQTDQVCDNFAVHPDLPLLKTLYDEDNLAFFANTGVLQEYCDKDDWYVETNTQLFAHNVQQRDVQQVGLVGAQGTGISGRMADTLTAKGFQTGSFSLANENFVLTGQPQKSPTPVVLSGYGGVLPFNAQESMDDMNSMFFDLNNSTSSFSGKFGKTWADIFDKAIRENVYMGEILEDVELNTNFPDSHIGSQLKMVSSVMKARDSLGHDRQFFFVDTGGWDTHSNQVESFDELIPDLNTALSAFVDEMKDQNLWDDVVLFEVSDFARTMATNSGEGTDHAWGGNYFMFGGGVKSQMLGKYPSDLSDQGDLSIGNGRLIPTTAFEEIWNSIAQWMGVDDPSSLDEVIPGRNNFNLFSQSDLFKQ